MRAGKTRLTRTQTRTALDAGQPAVAPFTAVCVGARRLSQGRTSAPSAVRSATLTL